MSFERIWLTGVLSLIASTSSLLIAEEKNTQQPYQQRVPEDEWNRDEVKKAFSDEVIRVQLIRLNLDPFLKPDQPEELKLELSPFDDVSLTLLLKPGRKPSAESRGWSGTVSSKGDDKPGYATVIVRKEDLQDDVNEKIRFRLFARIQTASNQVFNIEPFKETDNYLVKEIDLDALPPVEELPQDRKLLPVPEIPPPPPLPLRAFQAKAAGTQIDLLVVYTEQARLDAGGVSQILGNIDSAAFGASECLTKSQVNAQFFVVHKAELPDAETPVLLDNLERLRIKNDGYMDTVHCLRNLHKADLVCLVVKSGGRRSGWGYPMCSGWNNHSFEEFGFSVMRYGNMCSSFALPHELGHNMGGLHHSSSSGTPLFSYSYGYSFAVPGKQYKTIMSTQVGDLIPFFSNPDVTHPATGHAVGDPATANVAETFRSTVPTVSGFR